METAKLFRVLSQRKSSGYKHVNLEDSESAMTWRIRISPFVYVCSDVDTFEVRFGDQGQVVSIRKRMERQGFEPEWARVYPYYLRDEELSLGGEELRLPVVVKEVTSAAEFAGLRYLDQFHYLKARPTWGRQMYLVAKSTQRFLAGTPLPDILGCAVLTSPSLFSGPRNRILGWQGREDLTNNVDRVVRVARVIVHPEFRGLGLGTALVRHTMEYARDYWNVKGKTPWVVEAVAEMSRHHPFFEKGGLQFVGFTGAHDSAVYLGTDPKTLGIQQGKGHVMASLRRFKQKVHTAKPYLMASLLPPSDDLSRRVSQNAAVLVPDDPPLQVQPLTKPIVLQDVSVTLLGTGSWETCGEQHRSWAAENLSMMAEMESCSRGLSNLVDLLADGCQTSSDETSRVDAVTTALGGMRASLDRYTQLTCRSTAKISAVVSGLAEGLADITRHQRHLGEALSSVIGRVEADLSALNGQAGSDGTVRSRLNHQRKSLLEVERQLRVGSWSDRSQWVSDAFGVETGQRTNVLAALNLEIWPGDIVLIMGPSGSGKSTLLSAIKGHTPLENGSIGPEGLQNQIACLDINFDPAVSLIDLVGADMGEAIYLLNLVDLGEAHLYLKRRDQISHGQRYRAAFARMLAQRRPVWLADEFCAFLDPVTTVTLCRAIRNLVRKHKITFIAAASKDDYLIDALRPDFVVYMNAGGRVEPSPALRAWSLAPSLDSLLCALDQPPEHLGRPLVNWLERNHMLVEDCRTGSLTWAPSLRGIDRADVTRKARAIASSLWRSDWLFHRIWNHYQHSGKLPASPALCVWSSGDWPISKRKLQVNRRLRLCGQLAAVQGEPGPSRLFTGTLEDSTTDRDGPRDANLIPPLLVLAPWHH
jgi:ABC-type lipoprotein export system ATPase subunit/GNAT superfamily N-acetyltransferase